MISFRDRCHSTTAHTNGKNRHPIFHLNCTNHPLRHEIDCHQKQKVRGGFSLNTKLIRCNKLKNFEVSQSAFSRYCDSTPYLQKHRFLTPKTKKNLSNLAIFYVFHAIYDSIRAPTNNIQQEQWKWRKHHVTPRPYQKQEKKTQIFTQFPYKSSFSARNTDSPSRQTSI